MRSSSPLRVLLAVALASSPLACSKAADNSEPSDSEPSDSEPSESDGIAAGACETATRSGSFELTLEDEYSGLQGRVESGVTPFRVPEVVDSDGLCTFYRPPGLFCDPLCLSGETCDVEGVCIETPVAVSAGIVSVDGLADVVEMEASQPAYFYTYIGDLDHPPAAEGAPLTLHVSGAEGLTGFSLDAFGIAALEVTTDTVTLDPDVPVTVSWEASGEASTTINAVLNIAQHGGTPGWIECDFPDTGELEIPVSLTNQLLNQGFSGFPSLLLTRRSADSTETEVGCVQWAVESAQALAVEINGVTSCSTDADCTPPEACQANLICG